MLRDKPHDTTQESQPAKAPQSTQATEINPESDDFFLAMCQTMMNGAGMFGVTQEPGLQAALDLLHTDASRALTAELAGQNSSTTQATDTTGE